MTADRLPRVYLLAGEPVVLLVLGGGRAGSPRNALLLLPDGGRVVRPFRGLRRLRIARQPAESSLIPVRNG